MNFAIESHVDCSIENSEVFLQINVIGVSVLIDACRKYGIYNELGWKPEMLFEDGIEKTIMWYLNHNEWWERINEQREKRLTHIVFIVYIIGVLSLTFIIRETMTLRTPDNRGVVLEPFREMDAMMHQPNHFFWFMQIFLNILLFVSFGFLLPMISERFRSLWLTTATGFTFPLGSKLCNISQGVDLQKLMML